VYLVIFFWLSELDWVVSPLLVSLSTPVLCKMDRSGFLPALSAAVASDGDKAAMTSWVTATAVCGDGDDLRRLTTGVADKLDIDLRKERSSRSFRNESSHLLLSDFLPCNTKQLHINNTSKLTYNNTRLMTLCLGQPGWAGTWKVKPIWIYWIKRQWVAVATGGPYANLHLAPDRQPCQHLTTQFLQAGCPSCHPTSSVNWNFRDKVISHTRYSSLLPNTNLVSYDKLVSM